MLKLRSGKGLCAWKEKRGPRQARVKRPQSNHQPGKRHLLSAGERAGTRCAEKHSNTPRNAAYERNKYTRVALALQNGKVKHNCERRHSGRSAAQRAQSHGRGHGLSTTAWRPGRLQKQHSGISRQLVVFLRFIPSISLENLQSFLEIQSASSA